MTPFWGTKTSYTTGRHTLSQFKEKQEKLVQAVIEENEERELGALRRTEERMEEVRRENQERVARLGREIQERLEREAGQRKQGNHEKGEAEE